MSVADSIALLREGKARLVTRTELLDVLAAAERGDRVEVVPAPDATHFLGAEVMALREQLTAAQNEATELRARLARVVAAANGEPA